jgi:hypothetical protein
MPDYFLGGYFLISEEFLAIKRVYLRQRKEILVLCYLILKYQFQLLLLIFQYFLDILFDVVFFYFLEVLKFLLIR